MHCLVSVGPGCALASAAPPRLPHHLGFVSADSGNCNSDSHFRDSTCSTFHPKTDVLPAAAKREYRMLHSLPRLVSLRLPRLLHSSKMATSASSSPIIGVIGGSGLYKLQGLKVIEQIEVKTVRPTP